MAPNQKDQPDMAAPTEGQAVTVEDLLDELRRLTAQTETTAGDQLALLSSDMMRADTTLIHTIGNLINEVQAIHRILAKMAGQDGDTEELADIDIDALVDEFTSGLQARSLVEAVNYMRQKVSSNRPVIPGQTSIPIPGEEG